MTAERMPFFATIGVTIYTKNYTIDSVYEKLTYISVARDAPGVCRVSAWSQCFQHVTCSPSITTLCVVGDKMKHDQNTIYVRQYLH